MDLMEICLKEYVTEANGREKFRNVVNNQLYK